MATEKETVILDFQVDQGDAISELEKTKKSILQLKQEQLDLNKAYKAGNVTLDEYASESVRIEGILKKQTSTYNNVQKSVTGVKTQMDKLIDSNKKISQSFEDTAKNINIAGVNIGDLTGKVTSFLNPVTAAVGIVGALGAAYARSTVGAKDLEFATNQLSISIGLISNRFADLINSSNEDGEGAFTRLFNSILRGFGGGAGVAVSKQLALAKEQLDDLGREEISVRSAISDRLADNQELLTKIQDSQTSYNDKIHLTFEMIQNISKNEDELVEIKNKQLDLINKQLQSNKEDEKLQEAALLIQKDISNVQKDAERRRQGILRLESNITDQYNKQVEAKIKERDIQAEEARKELRKDVTKRGAGDSGISTVSTDVDFKQLAKNATREVKLYQETEEGKQEAIRASFELKRQLQEQDLAYTAMILGQANALVSEQTALGKVLSIAQATINTYQGANLALATIPPPFGYISAALTIATGLANVAKISGIAAAGGADFTTKGPTMLLVGDNPGGKERVTVEPLSGKGQTKVFGHGIAMAGGGTLTTGIDGGAAKSAATSEVNQTIMMMNAYKNMPTPVVSVKEITKTQNRVRVKEKVSTLSGRK